MRLIKKVEVNYLRSLYSLSIDRVGDLNVIFGRNDSGKSNLLRALNLFFNEKTDNDRLFDFDLDMSDPRKREAQKGKTRQFVWIKISFFVPKNYQSSLGNEIAVKKQWNRDGIVTQSVFPHLDSAGKQARLTRFLNDIDFTYIPAIKDLNVYSDLIERMYGAAAETAVLQEATGDFVEAIGGQASDLTEQLTRIFSSPAKLSPPTEMRLLFRNLDFAHGDEGHSLMRQKGDGVKARHLPELLRFINENEVRKKLYLWGFEEPENSLDLGAAEAEAGRLAEFASRVDTQVFVTSHSPAFYLAQPSSDANVRRYFISGQVANEIGEMLPRNAAAQIDDIDVAEAKMERAGLLQLPFVIRNLKEQKEALAALGEEAAELRKKLHELKEPTLVVEGKHDASLFQSAFERIGPAKQIVVKQIEGAAKKDQDTLIAAMIKQGAISASAPTLLLFDNDRTGRSAYHKLCKDGPNPKPNRYSPNLMVWALPFTDEFKSFLKRFSIRPEQAFFPAEFLYPGHEAASLCNELVEEYQGDLAEWKSQIHGDYYRGIGQSAYSKMVAREKGTPDWLYARGVPDALKEQFVQKATEGALATDAIDAIAVKVADAFFNDGGVTG